ncbi:MAG TPA: glycosyltransferase family 1 protein [Chondromyces sp.]|nr:glycosyltransferase family 1 protein [Chondromyces sp.]
MRIGVIAAELEGRRTGVGRYLEGMLGGLQSWDHGAEWHLFFQGDRSTGVVADDPWLVPHFSEHHGSRVVWEQLRLPRELARYRLDLVFGPAYTLPFGLRVPAVVALHDLSFELLPDEFGPRERWRRRLLARRAARVARRVLTDTAHMAGLVRAHYKVPAGRIGTVPLGVEAERFSPQPGSGDGPTLARLGVRRPYLLWVGTVLERRRPREVLEAFSKLRAGRPELQLVIAGANRLRSPEQLHAWVEELALGPHILELGWVDEPALAPLYRGAELGFYLSRHEGFGIPPLECLACGTPVVVSPGLGLDEIWPDYPLRCAADSADEIAEMARQVLAEPGWAVRRLSEAPRIIGGLDWESSSRRLVAELRRAVAA